MHLARLPRSAALRSRPRSVAGQCRAAAPHCCCTGITCLQKAASDCTLLMFAGGCFHKVRSYTWRAHFSLGNRGQRASAFYIPLMQTETAAGVQQAVQGSETASPIEPGGHETAGQRDLMGMELIGSSSSGKDPWPDKMQCEQYMLQNAVKYACISYTHRSIGARESGMEILLV
jgi:hypothetical protein